MPQAVADQIDRMASRREDLLFIHEEACVAESALKMAEKHVGSLIVRSDEQALAGILTERDILRRLVAQGRDPFSVTVSAIMSTEVISCGPQTTIGGIQQIFAKYQIRHLPIVEDDIVVGFVTSRDIHAYELAQARQEGQRARAAAEQGAIR